MILNRDRNVTTAVSKSVLAYSACLALVFVAVRSLISPVIGVPLGQARAEKERGKKENKTKQPTSKTSREKRDRLVIIQPEIDSIASPQTPAVSAEEAHPPALVVDDLPLIETDPLAPTLDAIEALYVGQEAPVAQPIPMPTPAATIARNGDPTPAAVIIPGWEQDDRSISPGRREQDDRSKTPVIPESELLNVLTDIVKRDTDPSVRNEALQGIYRMRSDAAINSLIQLYDSISDSKIKGEIIRYMLRRNGDNSKAIAKLVSIAKNEKDQELRNSAIRALGSIKGEEGAEHLIQIYDSLQDQKMKQYVIKSLAFNKSRKAFDKLIQIAKNDADPTIRQAAVHSLYDVDGYGISPGSSR